MSPSPAPSLTYHHTIAVGHFARVLAGEAKRAKGQYQVVALLLTLWARARTDEIAPVVCVSLEQLGGIVSSEARRRQLVAKLVEIGAIERTKGRGYRLLRPKPDELDDVAREELSLAQTVVGSAVSAGDGGRASKRTSTSAIVSATDQADVLARLGRQRSDVRDVLADMAGLRRNDLRYSGKGSAPVAAAIDWLVTSGASWSEFRRVAERVQDDPHRPRRCEYAFDRSEYVDAFLNEVRQAKADSHSRSQVDAPEARSEVAEDAEFIDDPLVAELRRQYPDITPAQANDWVRG